MRYADYHNQKAEANFLGLWNQCCEGIAIVNEEKAKKVGQAGRDYYRAILCLLIPLIIWPLWTISLPQPPPKPTQVEIVRPVTNGGFHGDHH